MGRAGLQADFFEDYRGYSPKKPTQKERLLKLFEGGRWVSNIEMNKICFRYGARLWELQQAGYLFEKRNEKNIWYWKLSGKI